MDRKEMLLAMYPDAGPAWREAIEHGIDVSLLEYNLSLTPEQRLLQLEEMLRLHHEATAAREAADATDDNPPPPVE